MASKLSSTPRLDRVAAVPPGFVNFFLDWPTWARRGLAYQPPAEQAAEKVIVEHTSINPNKAAITHSAYHLGALRQMTRSLQLGPT